MKLLFVCLLSFSCQYVTAQHADSVAIPKGVNYKFCSPSVFEEAKTLVQQEISDSVSYKLNDGILFIGPGIWNRYKNIQSLKKISGGTVTIMFNNEKFPAKITQDEESFRRIWDHFRKEVSDSNLVLRKPTSKEIQYYWSVISFDIEEPLLIAETQQRRFILNISPGNMKLLWLDEVPQNF